MFIQQPQRRCIRKKLLISGPQVTIAQVVETCIVKVLQGIRADGLDSPWVHDFLAKRMQIDIVTDRKVIEQKFNVLSFPFRKRRSTDVNVGTGSFRSVVSKIRIGSSSR